MKRLTDPIDWVKTMTDQIDFILTFQLIGELQTKESHLLAFVRFGC